MLLDPRSALSGKNVFVLEDEPFIAMDIERIFEEAGAKNVDIFLRLDNAPLDDLASYDVAVIDLNIHGKSSIPVAQELKRNGIPFVIVTGRRKSEASDVSLAGVPKIEKPFDEKVLIKALLEEAYRLERLRA